MSQRSKIALSKLDKQALRQIVTLVVKQTGIRIKEGTFRYTAEDVRRQLTFGGDFIYGFGDFFKLVFVRSGTKRNKNDAGKYDILFCLEVELDNANGLKKDDKLYVARRKIADDAQADLEDFLIRSGLTGQPPAGNQPRVDGPTAATATPPGESPRDDTPAPGVQGIASP